MNMAKHSDLRSIGIDPEKEMAIITPAGQYFVFPNKETEPHGTSYIRFVDHTGKEQLYYDADEWSANGRKAGEEVMGAIIGAILSGAHLGDISSDEEDDRPYKDWTIEQMMKWWLDNGYELDGTLDSSSLNHEWLEALDAAWDEVHPQSLDPSSDFYNDHVDELEQGGLQSMIFRNYKYGWSSPTTKEGKGLWVRSYRITDEAED